MKKLRFIAVLLLIILLTSLSVSASVATDRVYDGAGILTSGDKERINNAFAEAEEKTGYTFRLYTTTEYFASESGMLSRLGFDENDDLIVLKIEHIQGTYYYELFTYGKAYSMVSDSDADYILDDDRVYSIKRGEIVSASVAFADITADTVTSNQRTAEVMKIAVPILLALLTAGIFIGVVVYTYKRKLKSPIYPVEKYAGLTLSQSSDDYVSSNVTRTRIQSSSGRSGGGGGGSRGRR